MSLADLIHTGLTYVQRFADPVLEVGAALWTGAMTLSEWLFALYAALVAPWI
jgi:hypothetical protein